MLSSTSVTLMSDKSRRRDSAGNGHSPGVDSMTVMGFPRVSYTPGQMCVAELDFPRASFPPGESCAEERDYIRLTLLAGSPVCAWTVSGSLLFGSPPQTCTGLFPFDVALSSAVGRAYVIILPINASLHYIGFYIYGIWIVLPWDFCYSSLGESSP